MSQGPGDQGPGERNLRIRTATDADLPHIVRLDEQAFPTDPYPFFVVRQLLTAFPDFLLLVEDDEDLRGYVFSTPPRAAESWVLSLGIVPDLRGHGLGRKLMVETLMKLRAEGARTVRLSVEPRNTPAITLYEDLGFVPDPDGPCPDYFGPGEDRLLMTLAL
ncbi:GNAT family N-acetyltransferase [Streptomyces sp. NPDC000345]|uniref:GNAT family N-acetyltransferase n=1 Tax=Streptomyces sp. NPDC000345 TaxID=3364537 RepID=UPI0036846320